MAEPELWVKTAGDTEGVNMLITGARGAASFGVDDLAAAGALVLRRVPFDEAVERIAAVHYEMERIARIGHVLWADAGERTREAWRKPMRPILRAALGDG